MVHTDPMHTGSKLFLGYVMAFSLSCFHTQASDWPQFLGPLRNGTVEDESNIADWRTNAPALEWKLDVGSGFSGPVANNNRVFLYHRNQSLNKLDCMDLRSGKIIWSYEHPTQYRDDFGFDDGPRATPCVHGSAIYLMSADGRLTAVNEATGKRIWDINAQEKWHAGKGFFGMAPSPLVYKDLVIYVIGGQPEAGIVALEAATGNIRWTATSDQAGYASPVIEQNKPNPLIWALTRESIHGINPVSGQPVYSRPFRSSINASVNAATPLLLPEGLFLSASYGVGGILLQKEGLTLKPVWSGDKQISNHYATCFYHQGSLFGFHGRQEFGPEFRCIEASTGHLLWSETGLGAGSVIRVNDYLLLMLESGELILASVNSERFEILGRKQILPSGVRAFPAYSNGYFIARSPAQLVALKIDHKSTFND